MTTFQERSSKVKEMFTDPDLELSLREIIRYSAYWLLFERALIRRNIAAMQCQKYANLLNEDLDVFALRKSIKKFDQ